MGCCCSSGSGGGGKKEYAPLIMPTHPKRHQSSSSSLGAAGMLVDPLTVAMNQLLEHAAADDSGRRYIAIALIHDTMVEAGQAVGYCMDEFSLRSPFFTQLLRMYQYDGWEITKDSHKGYLMFKKSL